MFEIFTQMDALEPTFWIVLAGIAAAGGLTWFFIKVLPVSGLVPVTPPFFPPFEWVEEAECCGDCRFWLLSRLGTTHEYFGPEGRCRKKAPVPGAEIDSPVRHARDWCGDGEKKKKNGPPPWGWQGFDGPEQG